MNNTNSQDQQVTDITQLNYIFLQYLDRYPTTNESSTYLNQTQAQIIQRITQLPEYLQKNNQWYGTLTYDNSYILTLTDFDNINYSLGMILGNGLMIGFTSSNIQCDKIYTTQQYMVENLQQTNAIQVFNPTSIILDNNQTPSVTQQQQLNMQYGIFNTQTTQTIDNSNVTLSCDTMFLRQIQSCTYQQFTITSDQSLSNIDLKHYMQAPQNITEASYFGNTIGIDGSMTYNFFIAKGKANKENVCCVSTYWFGSNSSAINIGQNIFKDKTKALNDFKINTVQGQQFQFGILSCYIVKNENISTQDQILDEAYKILINILQNQILTLRTTHISKWVSLYTSDFLFYPKDNLTATDSIKYNQLGKATKLSLYTLYCMINANYRRKYREFIIDFDGQLLSDVDMWFLPCVIILQPQIAKNLIQSRYKQIIAYKEESEQYENSGQQTVPSDVILDGQVLQYDYSLPQRVYNLGFIAISVWNYYRRSYDIQWLKDIGVKILTEIADFYLPLLQYDSDSDTYNTNDLIGPNNTVSLDNSLINYLIYLSLYYCISSFFEVNDPNYEKYQIYTKIKFNIDNNNVSMYDSSTYQPNPFNFMEPLFTVHSYYGNEFYDKYQQLPAITYMTLIIKALQQYEQYLAPTQINYTTNMLLIADLYANYAQCLPYEADRDANIAICDNYIQQYIQQTQCVGPWQQTKMEIGPQTLQPYGSSTPQNLPNVQQICQFILFLLTALGGFQIEGTCSDVHYYMTSMQLTRHNSTVFPKYIKTINYIVQGQQNPTDNSLTYP